MGKNLNNNFTFFIFVISLLIIIAGGTLSYWNWTTSVDERTAITFTANSNFSCSADGGGDITSDDVILGPASCTNTKYAIQRTITVTPTINNDTTDISMDLWLNIDSIGSGLSSSKYFKYALTTSSTSCSDNIISSGSFYGLGTGDTVNLLNTSYSSTTTDTYYLYIWIDSEETNSSISDQTFSMSLDGNCSNSKILTLYDAVANEAVLDNISSTYVSSETGIDFSAISSDTNGKGVYELNTTSSDTYPVYYYRGDVDNNNVLFANVCWQIVRTTDTGGIKLIYNGIPTDGTCDNSGTDSQLSFTSAYSDSKDSNAYVGYMYGNTSGSTYDLVHANTNNSTIKTYVDNWYKENMTSYESYLEDTVFCNDRSITSGTGIGSSTTYYGSYKRIYKNKSPSLTCTNKNDAFTVDDTSNGNGALTYPVALLTIDEASYAGGVYNTANTSYYLYTNQTYWTMTPYHIYNASYGATVWYINSNGYLTRNDDIYKSYGIRPVISLKTGIIYSKGDGSSLNPYIISGLYTITIAFDSNGGSIDVASKTVEYNSTYGELPTPTRKGYTFTGWYTSSGDKITSETTVSITSNITLYASWSMTLYDTIANEAVLDNISSTYVSSETGIDFSAISSDTNGKGVYELNTTSNDTYPVYYYRGDVDNNNVLFANYCWQIIRTTDTGGVKLIYNGIPTDGTCDNTGTDSQIGTSAFNSNYKSLSDVGYMYGTRYAVSSKITSAGGSKSYYGNGVTYSDGKYTLVNASIESSWSSNYANYKGYYTCGSSTSTTCTSVYYLVGTSSSGYNYITLSNGITADDEILYGSTVSYSNGTYTLNGTISIKWSEWSSQYNTLDSNHYTCFSTSNTCSSVYYINYTSSTDAYYATLSNGKLLSDLISETLDYNTTDSTIKTYIDSWYASNMTGYTNYLEDTVFCNDRSISSYEGWSETGFTTSSLLFSSYTRLNSNSPSLECSREIDSFTVSDENGNGALTYPIGLITADEIAYAGGKYGSSNSNYYLYTGQYYWSLSPSYVSRYAHVWEVYSSGSISGNYFVYGAFGVRPVVSLQHGTGYTGGDGSATSPYIIE